MMPMRSTRGRNRQAGGIAPPAYPGASPQVQQAYQQYASLPLAKLQQMAVMTPPGSAQGQMIRRAMTTKQMAPASTGAFQNAAPAAAPPANARGGTTRRYDDGGTVASGSDPAGDQGGSGGAAPAWRPRAALQAWLPANGNGAFPSMGGGFRGFPAAATAAAPSGSVSPSYGGMGYIRGANGAMLPVMSFSAGAPGEVGPSWSPGQALLSPQSPITTSPPGFGGAPPTPPLQTPAPTGFMPPDQTAPPPTAPPAGITYGAWAKGGSVPTPEEIAGREIYHPGGFLNSPVAGRTDHLPLAVPADSHVIPADVVSGLGEGNSLNGAAQLDAMLHAGPWGRRALASPAPGTAPRVPQAPPGSVPRERTTSILAAGGEYVVRPEAVAEIGRRMKARDPRLRGSDLKAGHDALDAFILRARRYVVAKTKKLPGPVRS